MGEPIWTPPAERVAGSNLTGFACLRARAPRRTGGDYASLWRWSVDERERFWSAVMEFAAVLHTPGTKPVLQHRDRMPGAVWFEDTRLNYAENLLARDDEHVALVFCNERGMRRELSYRELRAEVGRVAAGLGELGIGPGDRVAGFLPNLPEAVIAMLATTSLGAAWTSCSPDFGINGVLDRFGQVAPRLLFTADGYFYNGKTIDSLAPVRGVLEQLPSVERVVVIPYVSDAPDLRGLPNAVAFGEFGRPGAATAFRRVPFDTPLFVMYSSGTTGVPKCIVHGAGGTLLQHLKEHLLHTDLRRATGVLLHHLRLDDVELAGERARRRLHAGALRGLAVPPRPDVLWRMAERERVTVFGTSPKYLSSTAEGRRLPPREQVDLGALRTVLSTGSPLAPEGSTSCTARQGPTCSWPRSRAAPTSSPASPRQSTAAGAPRRDPVARARHGGGGVRRRGPAAARAAGRARVHAPRSPPCRSGFWNDPDGTRYRAAYFERFPGVWCHGDYAVHTAHGGFVILGRSDAVLNPGGVRIGTAEIYRQVEKLGEILESLAVGQDWDNDVRVVLFVRLRPGVDARRGARAQDPRDHPRPYDAAPRAGAHRGRPRHPTHHQRQDRGARGAQCHSRPPGAQHGRARQPRGARAFPRAARARELTVRRSTP
jgi:acetoacetyl-CoA synthetase